MGDPVTFTPEFTKEIYDDQHTEKFGPFWGRSKMYYFDKLFQGDEPITDYIDNSISTILDYGCGESPALDNIVTALPDLTLTTTKYDPNIEGIDTLPETTFDLVISRMLILLHFFRDNEEEGLEFLDNLRSLSNGKVFLGFMTPDLTSTITQYALFEINRRFIIEKKEVNLIEDKPKHLVGKYYIAMWLQKRKYVYQ